MFRMHNSTFPITLFIAVALAGCDSGGVIVADGNGHAHANGNCNGKNNCNNNEADSQVTTVSSDSADSSDSSDSGDESSTMGMPDMAEGTDTGTDTGDTESETGDPEPEPDPGLPGCGNGLPFKGDLCYHPHVQYAIANARNAEIGDMNGDGNQDVVTLSSTLMSVYLGNGSGALALSGSVGVVSSAFFFALGDIDDDGDLDAVVNGTSAMRVHLNNGAGVLNPVAVSYATFTQPRETLLVDLDADGDLDLAQVHNGQERKLAVRKNNGLGTFGPQTGYEIETVGAPVWLASADFDGDDAIDLLIGAGGNPVIVYNDGNGFYDAVNEQTIAWGTNTANLVVNDFDLDGQLDIAGARTSAAIIRILFGTGDGMFDPMMLDIPTPMNDPGPLTSADFDVDGIPDLAAADDAGGAQVSIHRGDGFGAFYDGVSFTSKSEAVSITSGDLNNDDVPDIVMVSDIGSPGLSVLRSNP